MKRFTLILTVVILFSCSGDKTKFSSESEFKDYINNPENGFIITEKSDKLIFEARLTPPIKGEKNGECTVNLRISRKDGGSVLDMGGASKQEALARENYLSFELRNDVVLKLGGKSFPPIFHHYERNYGLKPSIDIVFNFMKLDLGKDAVFTYRDQLFGQGLIRIGFDKKLFNSCYVTQN